MSESINLAPCLLARIILEQYVAGEHLLGAKAKKTKQRTTNEQQRAANDELYGANKKKIVSQMLHDPSLIRDARLRAQVEDCVNFDDNYSPLVDKIRQCVVAVVVVFRRRRSSFVERTNDLSNERFFQQLIHCDALLTGRSATSTSTFCKRSCST